MLPHGDHKAIFRKIKLDVRFDNGTIWLTRAMMAELFQSTVANINIHIKNIFEEGELREEATVKDFLIVRRESGSSV